jgi:glycosyltransferase involved in cell wall biosynthesis
MSSGPRVSVIITTYNRAHFLVEAIESVLNQSFPDFELIVADDGSSDDTAERVAALAGPIRYLRLPHSGRPEDGRNRAIAVSRGQLIAFLDDDDRWHRHKLARQVAAFDRNQSLGLVYSDFQAFYADGSVTGPLLSPHHKQSESAFTHLLRDCFVHPSTVVIRRRLFDRVGPFDNRFLSQGDYYFWLRATHAAPAHCIPDPLVSVRRHQASLAQARGIRNYQDTIQVLELLQHTTPLTLPQQLQLRRTLARLYTHVGLYLLRSADRAQARQHFLRSLRLLPFQRRAWTALRQSYSKVT